ncbi:helix-turn-helix transcriptional regulator [Lysobacter capsici]|uniref:helix-turn-helix transcriptional regulator n=1 Tax=Lysobacter capsici TaxID=435897 RepID=UPI001C001FDC|nr:helix-turn-helix transcriptional regulator [Lysobacter capsici]QWF16995.1 ArsR family transcriptional regulator [Lysobacter capsici]
MPRLNDANAFALLGDWKLLEIVRRLGTAGTQGCSGLELLALFSNLESRELTQWMTKLAGAGLVHGEVRGRVVHYFIKSGVIDELVESLRSDSILYITQRRDAERALASVKEPTVEDDSA